MLAAQDSPEGDEVEFTADRMEFMKRDTMEVRKLLYNVHFIQDSTHIYCDSAYQFLNTNTIEAYSNVRIVISYRSTITADRLKYNASTKVAELFDHITLNDGTATLKTEYLLYNRNTHIGYYNTGATLHDVKNTLTSQRGYYNTLTHIAAFRGNVKHSTPDFDLETDTLEFNTETETAHFIAPTHIHNPTSELYTELGYYNTKTNASSFYQGTWLQDTAYYMAADTIEYDYQHDYGTANGHIHLNDLDSTLYAFGDFGTFSRRSNRSMLTGNAYVVQYVDRDTLILTADTLQTEQDTLTDSRRLLAWRNNKVYMNQLQAITDSLVYNFTDSTLTFYGAPILWSDSSQLTGDTVKLWLRNRRADSLEVGLKGFLASRESSIGFNQVKGKHIQGKFQENRLVRLYVNGSAESVYWSKNEEEKYDGMNESRCDRMFIRMADNKPVRITFAGMPEGTYYPVKDAVAMGRRLDGFSWKPSLRPVRPNVPLP